MKSNHYTRKKTEPSLGKNPLTKSLYTETADVVLGLKPKPVVLYLMSEDVAYGGYELLQALLACGLRFGDKNIFNFYDKENPTHVLFHCAS